MISDDVGRQLHDRFTRDQSLSASEMAELEQWYAQMDQQECEMLARIAPSSSLAELTERIQALTTGNSQLRQEISVLQQQLSQKSAAQPA